eukprot:GHRR01004347.1.p1 GENE.GHRR01004347.1~~GHRR01004347.1.p1  ORF type:complete len:793 (+),score=335.48 GHRR01004347.1:335-2713(+)
MIQIGLIDSCRAKAPKRKRSSKDSPGDDLLADPNWEPSPTDCAGAVIAAAAAHVAAAAAATDPATTSSDLAYPTIKLSRSSGALVSQKQHSPVAIDQLVPYAAADSVLSATGFDQYNRQQSANIQQQYQQHGQLNSGKKQPYSCSINAPVFVPDCKAPSLPAADAATALTGQRSSSSTEVVTSIGQTTDSEVGADASRRLCDAAAPKLGVCITAQHGTAGSALFGGLQHTTNLCMHQVNSMFKTASCPEFARPAAGKLEAVASPIAAEKHIFGQPVDNAAITDDKMTVVCTAETCSAACSSGGTIGEKLAQQMCESQARSFSMVEAQESEELEHTLIWLQSADEQGGLLQGLQDLDALRPGTPLTPSKAAALADVSAQSLLLATEHNSAPAAGDIPSLQAPLPGYLQPQPAGTVQLPAMAAGAATAGSPSTATYVSSSAVASIDAPQRTCNQAEQGWGKVKPPSAGSLAAQQQQAIQGATSYSDLASFTGSSTGLADLAAATGPLACQALDPLSRSCSSTQLAYMAQGQQRHLCSLAGNASSDRLDAVQAGYSPVTTANTAGMQLAAATDSTAQHHVPNFAAAPHKSFADKDLMLQQPAAAKAAAGVHVVAGCDDALLLQPLVQPEMMVLVTPKVLPSMEQLLALLAAPLPVGAAMRPAEAYLEVSTFTSKGPQAISPDKLMCQLAVLGIKSQIAEMRMGELPGCKITSLRAGGARGMAGIEGAIVADLERLLRHLARNMRRVVDVGRVVLAMRLNAAVAEPGLVIATTAATVQQATTAVKSLVDQLALVYQ